MTLRVKRYTHLIYMQAILTKVLRSNRWLN
nr:MAG TPA: hypothetical protein [Caudoviricetes sp.]